MAQSQSPQTDPQPVAAVSDLTTDIVDVIKGYDTMLERAEADLLPIVERLHALHQSHAAALMEALEAMGGRPEDAGSMMGAVHTAVATARDWFGALDTSALDQIIKGEDRLLESYASALREIGTASGLDELVKEQRAALQSHVGPLRTV